VFSDEVYRGIERHPDLQLPSVADRYERGLSLGVMSKAYGLPGLRIGWIACRDASLLDRMHSIKHYLSICNAAPSELLATMALKARAQILARNRALIARNLPLLTDFFAGHADRFHWEIPDGGCIAYPRYRGAEGVDTFTRNLVERAGVLLLPASVYRSALGPTPQDRFRIGFGREAMPTGLAVLSDFLRMG
jgi:aspartate/methionine/tyrosine aminotransferase